MNISERQRTRFESRLIKDENGCMNWQGGRNSNGYGLMGITIDGKKIHMGTHKFALIMATNQNPKDLEACHNQICKSKACCAPEHLRWDTHKENVKDMIEMGRLVKPDTKGEKHGMCKLTEVKVKEIRAHIMEGKKTQKEISEIYGVASRTISDIKSRKSWKHI